MDFLKAVKCTYTGKECYSARELTLLYEISLRLMRSRNVADVLYGVQKQLCQFLSADSSFLTVLNRTSSQIVISEAYGLSPAQQNKGTFEIGEGVVGRVVELARPIVIPKISESNLFINKPNFSLHKDGKDFAFVCVPVMEDDRVVGTLSCTKISVENEDFSEIKRLLTIIGSMIVHSVRARQSRIEEMERLQAKNLELMGHMDQNKRPFNIIGNSGKMRDVYNMIEMVAPTNSTVLIRGESGIGKELVADAIHYQSNRTGSPFIKVNCSALPESLIESELFGHEKGAFTGADARRKGRFELAHKGTIFLDEIGDIPLSTQVKILRTLQEREFERVGGTETIKVDVRVIAATNRNLEEMIEEGEFREDLFYRINVFPLYIPPLRERKNDIPLLVDHFIQKFNKRNNADIKRITSKAMTMLMNYSWPGNVRELENVIERSCILSTDNVLHSYHLPFTIQTPESTNTQMEGGLAEVLDTIEKQLLLEALSATKGHIGHASERLKITERILGLRIKKHKIDTAQFKNRGK